MKIFTLLCCFSTRSYSEMKHLRVVPLMGMEPSYENTISETITVSKMIDIHKTSSDGRMDSAIKEQPFLKELKTELLRKHPLWDVVISPPRAPYDVMINTIRINLKITECKSSDNSMNKPSIYFSITGNSDYPYSSSWNDFLEMLTKAKLANMIKQHREKETEYHYLVKNKVTGDVLLKPIFDIHTYISNPSNNLQINWKNEFENINYRIDDKEYLTKVHSLLFCIQKSVKEMIARTSAFAESDISFIKK